MKNWKVFVLERRFWGIVGASLLLGLCGCVTTTEIDDGDGVVMQEEPPLVDQVKVDR